MQTTSRPAREDRPWSKDFWMDIMMLFLRDCASRDRFILRNLGFVGVPVFPLPASSLLVFPQSFHLRKQIHDFFAAESSCDIDGLFTIAIGLIRTGSRFQERSHDAESPVPTTCPVQRRVARIHRLNVGVCTVCQKYTHHGGSARSARSMQWRFSRAIQDVYAPALAQEPPNSPVIADPRISMHGRFRSAITCIGVFIVRDAVAVSHVS